MSSSESGNKAIVAAGAANLGIAIAKFVGFLITGASSMLAESIHSLADTTNQGLLLLGGKRAQREPDPQHPFGHGHDRYFYAFVVAVVLFTAGSAFALYEAVHKIMNPEPVDSAIVAIVILVVAIGLEGFSFRTAVVESRPLKSPGTTWWQFIRRTKSPELPVVLLEDSAALLGLVFALAGVGMAVVTGNGIWDGIGTLLIGILLFVVAVILAVEMKSLLVGESANRTDVEALGAAIVDGVSVTRIIHMRTMHLGPDELLVAAKIAVDNALTVRELAGAIDGAETRARAAVPIARIIYLEPDVDRGPEEAALDPALSQPAPEPA